MQQPTLQASDPRLREKSIPVALEQLNSPEIISLKQDLLDTLLAQKTGVAISAVQIGVLKRVCLVYIQPRPNQKSYGPKYFFNPVILESSAQTADMYEACLSVDSADLYASVKRPAKVKLQYFDETGTELTEEFSGFKARIMQHELGHMDGELFVDIAGGSTKMTEAQYQQMRDNQ